MGVGASICADAFIADSSVRQKMTGSRRVQKE